jgi:hypothetical protein
MKATGTPFFSPSWLNNWHKANWVRMEPIGCHYIWEGVGEQHLIWPICLHPGDLPVWYLGEDIIKSKLSESYQLCYELSSKRCQEFWDWGLRSYLSRVL